MNLNITGQYKYIAKEQERLRKMIEKNGQRLAWLKIYLQHAEDIKKSRAEIKVGKLYTLDEVEKKLGLK